MAHVIDPPGIAPADDEVSIFELGTSVLLHRWSIFWWMFVGAAIAVVLALQSTPTFTASASFLPQTKNSIARSGLATLAGQFGLRVSDQSDEPNSPDFYVELLTSRVVLQPIVTDTFVVPERGPASAVLLDLLEVKTGIPQARRLELGVDRLQAVVQTNVSAKTGVVTVGASTPWPSLSRELVDRLIAAVNDFNLRTRQNDATTERKFTENRLSEARASLRAAEDRLQSFLQANRQFTTPELHFQHDRLERDVNLNQQIVTSLAQSYEEVRIREVRNTPVVTIIEPAAVPTAPDPRRRILRVIGGIILGGMIGVIIAWVKDISRRRVAGNPEAETFFSVLGDAKRSMGWLVPGWRKRTPT